MQPVKTAINISGNVVNFITVNLLALNIVIASFAALLVRFGPESAGHGVSHGGQTSDKAVRLQDTRFYLPSSKAVHGATSDSRLQSVCSSSVATDVRQPSSDGLRQPENAGEHRRTPRNSRRTPENIGERRRTSGTGNTPHTLAL